MRNRNMVKTYLNGSLLILGAVVSFQSVAVTSASANVVITVTSPQPTCNLTVRSTYDLGVLPLSEKKHVAFPVNIDCTGSIRTALIAQKTSGTLQADNYRVAIPIGSTTSSLGPYLWLQTAAGANINLTGADSGKFCDASGQNRVCQITPVTNVQAGAPFGQGSATISFSVVYPA